ncbi:unnamed protein product [Rotaria magnacalcarata]|uniref:Voltage-gated hydrogen channel 1 n=3 Tax=Rotaria magnacalcarata TaxID=392030 RepID=A0A815W4F5_9BILA|nr:unnamed protein product [Rotaria magnacalcarata]CAF2165266.1 unnamed protein product [Rotaria magnacalcarata]CAF4709922.1 unnamed protein product [Rotaria magnacalcarata]
MNETNTKSYPNDYSESKDVDLTVALLIPKHRMTLGQHFDRNTEKVQDQGCCFRFDNPCCSILSRWWNVQYKWQRRMVRLFESPLFHIIITTLVFIDCILTITAFVLDFIELKRLCDSKSISHATKKHNKEDERDRIELAVEIIEYCCMALLVLFVVEVLIKIYVFGRHWWNFQEKKMEWLDTIVVIATFAIALATMHRQDLFAAIPLLFISLRLWRIIEIINSVAQAIQSQEEIRKKHLKKKTLTISDVGPEMTRETYDQTLEKFETVDQSCRTILEHCPKESSLGSITETSHRLQDAIEDIRLLSLSINLPSSNAAAN